MVDISINDKEFNDKLNELCEKLLPEAIKQGMEKACLVVERQAKKNCPVDDGQLRASITHEVTQSGDNTDGVVGTNMDYAPFVHNGTGIYAKDGNGRLTQWKYQSADGEWHTTTGQKPQPFLSDALEQTKGDIIKQFEGLI